MKETGAPRVIRQNKVEASRPWRTHEAAEWSGMSERKLLDLAREGILPAKKVGGTWYFSPDRLAEFFDVSF